ncbi:hypothetical protein HMPREF0044_0985 [Gleimia coleocanis DSM 15436]|uniref:SNARE-like domain protein n=1 Tax=Gleimia coleocanis DSM 15436 TaxID=525245 RepID=C0W0A7_9ACTO|nr:hypothetical protein [Gleimia coleocanis]EEH63966.1 hypothetical protein HMPREF0044_0985 [Gleimia coleocanis DSM 15436]
MTGVPDFILHGPFPILVIFLAIVVCFRSQGTYWLARLITTGVIKTSESTTKPWLRKIGKWLEGASVQQGVDIIDRWGLIAIPLSFLTIGIQTIIHAGAGVLRLRWWLYTLVAVPGYFAWGFLYATVTLSILKTGQAAVLGKTWAILLTLGIVLIAVLFSLRRYKIAKARVKNQLD